MGKSSWFSSDSETGKVVAKTDIHNDGSVHRYEYTTPDNIKGGHGHKIYSNYSDYEQDKVSWERDKNDSESIGKRWKGNGYDLGVDGLSYDELLLLKEHITNGFIHTSRELMMDEIECTKKIPSRQFVLKI